MLSDFLTKDPGKSERERFFEKFDENDPAFSQLIYRDASAYVGTPSQANFITIVYGLEWPRLKGLPVPYSKIEGQSSANRVIASLYRTKDFLERHVGAEMRLYDVRTGCVRVRFFYEGVVDEDQLRRAIELLKSVAVDYYITSVSATFEGHSLRIDK